MATWPDAITIFLLPPDVEELDRRLLERATEDPAQRAERLQVAHQEMDLADRYLHRVVNDDLYRVVEELERIVGG